MNTSIKLKEWPVGVAMVTTELQLSDDDLSVLTHVLRRRFQEAAENAGAIVMQIEVTATVKMSRQVDSGFCFPSSKANPPPKEAAEAQP